MKYTYDNLEVTITELVQASIETTYDLTPTPCFQQEELKEKNIWHLQNYQ